MAPFLPTKLLHEKEHLNGKANTAVVRPEWLAERCGPGPVSHAPPTVRGRVQKKHDARGSRQDLNESELELMHSAFSGLILILEAK